MVFILSFVYWFVIFHLVRVTIVTIFLYTSFRNVCRRMNNKYKQYVDDYYKRKATYEYTYIVLHYTIYVTLYHGVSISTERLFFIWAILFIYINTHLLLDININNVYYYTLINIELFRYKFIYL